MKKNVKNNTGLIALILGTFMLPTTTFAQIDADVDINVGEITILYSFTDIDVDLDATALGNVLAPAPGCAAGALATNCDEGDAGGPITATENAGNLEASFDITSAITDVSAVDLVLQNVWAVRALGGATAHTTVGVTVAGGTTISNGASQIAVTNGVAAPATFADPGLGTPQVGDVTLTLDFTDLTLAGNHDSGNDAGDTVYTIEVTAN